MPILINLVLVLIFLWLLYRLVGKFFPALFAKDVVDEIIDNANSKLKATKKIKKMDEVDVDVIRKGLQKRMETLDKLGSIDKKKPVKGRK